MSKEYDNTNRGVLFINERKQTDKHPDRTGSLNVDGVEYFLDGWIKSKDGKQFLSLSVKRKDKQKATPPPAAATATTPAPDDDDIPF